MTLDQIRYFVELCHTLNFTRAAENLYVSQPSLSKQISKLEEELQVRLVERTSRKVVLTPAGVIFYQEFSRILNEADNAVFKVKNAGRKVFRLAVFQPFSSHERVRDILSRAGSLPEDYELHIYLMKYQEILEAYRTHSVDLFIIPSSLVPSLNTAADEAQSRTLQTLPLAFVFSDQLCRPEEFAIDKLNGHKFLVLESGYSGGDYRRELSFLAQHGCVPSQVQKTGDILNTIRYIDPSDSFGIVYDLFANDKTTQAQGTLSVGGPDNVPADMSDAQKASSDLPGGMKSRANDGLGAVRGARGLYYAIIQEGAFSSQLLSLWHKDCPQAIKSYIDSLLEENS